MSSLVIPDLFAVSVREIRCSEDNPDITSPIGFYTYIVVVDRESMKGTNIIPECFC